MHFTAIFYQVLYWSQNIISRADKNNAMSPVDFELLFVILYNITVLHYNTSTSTGLSELFLLGGCVKKVGGCDELKTKREGGLHSRFLHLN